MPAVFARLMNEKFAAKVGNEARVRVTAPEQLVRNRKSLPDAWEAQIIESVFLDPQRAKGEAYHGGHRGGWTPGISNAAARILYGLVPFLSRRAEGRDRRDRISKGGRQSGRSGRRDQHRLVQMSALEQSPHRVEAHTGAGEVPCDVALPICRFRPA